MGSERAGIRPPSAGTQQAPDAAALRSTSRDGAPGQFDVSRVRVSAPAMTMTRPGDHDEQEADRMADAALAGRAAVRPSCDCKPMILRKCAACEDEDDRKLARKATSGASPAPQVAPQVRDVVGSPGQPLRSDVRGDLEARFQQDFSHVRVHDDARAAATARAVNSLAFTYGSDIVFDQGRYRPESAEGRRLLAHELAHVVQQTRTGSRPKIARFVPAAVYAEAPPQVITVPSQGTPGASSVGGMRYAAPPSGSLAELQQRLQAAQDVDEAKLIAERPIATLEVGGPAPDFILNKGTQTQTLATDYQPWPTFTYRLRYFSVLDALAYDISKVSTEDQLKGIYNAYFPDSLYTQWGSLTTPSTPTSMMMPLSGSTTLGRLANSLEDVVVYRPKSFDPGAVARTAVFVAAAKERAKTLPQLSGWELFKQIAQSDLDVAVQGTPKAGPCQEAPKPRAGGNPDHDAYATQVTGSMTDYWIKTPEGLECTTDGLDANNPKQLWEVKTGQEIFGEAALAGGAINAPYILNRLYKLEAQRERCTAAARRCGYSYSFAFDNEVVAKHVRKVWGNNPPVVFKPRP